MLCVRANSSGKIIVDNYQPSDPALCTAHVLVNPSEYGALTSSVNVNMVDLGASWGFAFGAIMLFWSIGYKGSIAKQGIRSIK